MTVLCNAYVVVLYRMLHLHMKLLSGKLPDFSAISGGLLVH
jgi:hypothetical protein